MKNFLNNSWSIRCQCPQCSAPVTFEETDRILSCPFCKVRLFFSPGDYVRYCLPAHESVSAELFFVPYWRFKGMIFSCENYEIKNEIVDATILALQKLPLNASLGLRPQAMQLRFITPDIKGKFLAHDMPKNSMVSCIEDRLKTLKSAPPLIDLFHKAWIGETMCMIYTPVYIEKDVVFDGVIRKPLTALSPTDINIFSVCDETLYQEMQFIPTLCPNCGWNLEGEKDSIIFGCGNCSSVWQVSGSGLKKVDFSVISGKSDSVTYLPFWRIKAQVKGLELQSYADLIRLANLPKAIREEWENTRLCFWLPAFKVRPDLLIRIGRFMTIAQLQESSTDCLPKSDIYPVTLPALEAEECLKIVLADISIAKRKLFPLLENIEIKTVDTRLVYIPFEPDRDDLSCPGAKLIIPKNALKYGRNI